MINEIIEFIRLWREEKQDKQYDSYRSERIYIRVTPEEKELINKLAKCQCLDKSNFIRWLIFSKYINDFVK